MDILEFAINMELDGEKYYNEQAALNQDNSLNSVFLMLAKDENNHAKILRSRSQGAPYELNELVLSTTKSVFQEMVDFKIETKQKPEQVDLYRLALEKEKQSIDLYIKLLSEANADRELFQFLIKQEEEHFEIIEEIIKMVNRPNDWVESAEFGIRKEY